MSVKATIKNDREVKQMLQKDFPNYARFAIANTASRVAFLGLERSESQMRRDFTLRNRYLVSTRPGRGALQFNRAIPHHDINKISSSWGSPAKIGRKDYEFLEEQEDGFSHSGPVPTESARISNAQKKRIRRINYIKQMAVRNPRDFGSVNSDDPLAQTWAMLQQAYKEGYGLPGTDQFFYMKKEQLPSGMTEGWFQFATSGTAAGDRFPRWKQVYYNGKNDRRMASHWMRDSKNTITQADIERFYLEEAKKAFTRQITKSW